MDSLCHPWFTTTNVSYRFPILKLPPPPCAVLLVYLGSVHSIARGTASELGLFMSLPLVFSLFPFVSIRFHSLCLLFVYVPYIGTVHNIFIRAIMWQCARYEHRGGQDKVAEVLQDQEVFASELNDWDNEKNNMDIHGPCGRKFCKAIRRGKHDCVGFQAHTIKMRVWLEQPPTNCIHRCDEFENMQVKGQ